MIKAIAIDDEPIALDVIKNHAEKIDLIDIVAFFSSATEAYSFLQRHNDIQLVFMDINMPDVSGLELAEHIKQPVQIVFTTAYPEHAVKGFELAATDYLLKPIDFERFFKACKLADTRLNTGVSTIEKESNLFVKDGYNWVKINFNDLLYAEANDNYVSLFEAQKRTLTRMTLSKLLTKLPKEKFIQVHKSFVVSLSKIDKVEKGHLIVAGAKIPVSNSFKENLLLALNK